MTLPGHFRWPEVTWRHFLSRDYLLLHLQRCRKSNAQNPPVFGLLGLLLGDLRWNDVTSGSLLVAWVHVTSFPVTWLPPPARYSLRISQTHSVRQLSAFYSHFEVTSGQMTSLPVTSGQLRSRDVISCHMTASSCEQQPGRKSNAQYAPLFGLLQPLPGNFRSNDVTSGHFRSPEVMWRHFLSLDCLLLWGTAL